MIFKTYHSEHKLPVYIHEDSIFYINKNAMFTWLGLEGPKNYLIFVCFFVFKARKKEPRIIIFFPPFRRRLELL